MKNIEGWNGIELVKNPEDLSYLSNRVELFKKECVNYFSELNQYDELWWKLNHYVELSDKLVWELSELSNCENLKEEILKILEEQISYYLKISELISKEIRGETISNLDNEAFKNNQVNIGFELYDDKPSIIWKQEYKSLQELEEVEWREREEILYKISYVRSKVTNILINNNEELLSITLPISWFIDTANLNTWNISDKYWICTESLKNDLDYEVSLLVDKYQKSLIESLNDNNIVEDNEFENFNNTDVSDFDKKENDASLKLSRELALFWYRVYYNSKSDTSIHSRIKRVNNKILFYKNNQIWVSRDKIITDINKLIKYIEKLDIDSEELLINLIKILNIRDTDDLYDKFLEFLKNNDDLLKNLFK